MILDASLLNTRHYKVRINGKLEQSKERSGSVPYTRVVAIEKEAFGSPSTTIGQLLNINDILKVNRTEKDKINSFAHTKDILPFVYTICIPIFSRVPFTKDQY